MSGSREACPTLVKRWHSMKRPTRSPVDGRVACDREDRLRRAGLAPEMRAPTVRGKSAPAAPEGQSGDAFPAFVDQPVPYGIADQRRAIVEREFVQNLCNV